MNDLSPHGSPIVRSELRTRIKDLVRKWNVTVEQTRETESSVLLFGRRANQAVVLYEVGGMLRNPVEDPDLFTSAMIIHKRLDRLARELSLDAERALRWAFAQAVLSAIWEVEDGCVVDAANSRIRLALTIRDTFR